MKCRSFRHFVEQEVGQVPCFLIYAVLELTLMAILFLDGALAYLATVFAELFELVPPCLLCTRVNPLFDRADPDLHYSTSMCEGHKKEISSFAYCHVHRKLSDLRTMCEGCLLALASEDMERLFNDELGSRLKTPSANVCSCCGEPMKAKSSSYQKPGGLANTVPAWVAQTPCSSPRTAFSPWKNEDARAAPISIPPTPEDMAEDLIRSPRFLFESVGVNEAEDSQRQDRKSLVALSKELEEERSASAVAANNAMAMITRLQADKASVQMEALQYQRMMDEQAEYDQEALSALHDMLEKREYEMLDMQDELELYRERYGVLRDVVRRSDNFDKSQSFSSFTERSDHDEDDGHISPDESVFDIETDVDPDPSITYYDQAFALYENEHERSIMLDQWGMSEEAMNQTSFENDDDQNTVSENYRVRVVGEEEEEEEEGTVNDNDISDESEVSESMIQDSHENEPHEEANLKENDGEGRNHLEMVQEIPELGVQLTAD